jgi:hypothetical protein
MMEETQTNLDLLNISVLKKIFKVFQVTKTIQNKVKNRNTNHLPSAQPSAGCRSRAYNQERFEGVVVLIVVTLKYAL